MALIEEIMQAALQAPDERKAEAVRILKGEARPSDDFAAAPGTGPLLLGMGEAARHLGVSRSTLWRLLRVQAIEKVELFPGSFRVRRSDLERLAALGIAGCIMPRRRGRPCKSSGPGRATEQEAAHA